MSTVALRHRVRSIVEPSTEPLPTLQLDGVVSGTARLLGDLKTQDPSGNNLFQSGDVLFSKLRPYLAKSWRVRHRMQGSGEFLCLRPGPALDVSYLQYLTLSRPWLDHAVLTSYGTKMPRTSWEQMAQLQIPDMPIEQQRRIADFLDDRVARIDQIVEARSKQASLITENLRGQVEARLRPFPKLPMRYLSREILVGIVIQPSKLYTDDPNGVPALRGLNVREGEIVQDDLVRITPDGHRLNPRSKLRTGDVVVVRTGDAGSAAVVPAACDDWNCIDLVVVRPGLGVSAQYLELALNSAKHEATVAAAASGAMQQHFGVNALGSLPIPYPGDSDATVGQELAALRAETSRRIGDLRQSVNRLAEYRQSLITAAVTGEIDVTTTGSGIRR